MRAGLLYQKLLCDVFDQLIFIILWVLLIFIRKPQSKLKHVINCQSCLNCLICLFNHCAMKNRSILEKNWFSISIKKLNLLITAVLVPIASINQTHIKCCQSSKINWCYSCLRKGRVPDWFSPVYTNWSKSTCIWIR